MDKTHYKELIEKYFEETITDVEIKELSDWIKNDRQLHDWWEQEFERTDSSMNPVLRDKLFALSFRFFSNGSNTLYCESGQRR